MPTRHNGVGWLISGSLLLGVITLVGTRYMQSGGELSLGFSDPASTASAYSLSPWLTIAALTVLGVLAGVLVAAFKAMPQDKPVDLRSLLVPLLYPQTFIALCLSPLVFFIVAASIDIHQLGIASYIAAFQNGFFWKQIVAAREKQQTP